MRLKDVAIASASLTAFFSLWEACYWLIVKNPLVLAPPSKVFKTLLDLFTGNYGPFFMPLDILYSLFHYALGFGTAVVVGFSVGLVAGLFRLADRLSYPIIELVRPIPPIAWIPMAILMLGLTHQAAGFIIFIGAVFPILLNTKHGVASIELKYLEAAMTLGATKGATLIRKVVIPAALPSILTGIRVGSGVAWMCVVAAELFGVSRYGLGYQIQMAEFYHYPDVIIAYMLAIGMLGLALDVFYRTIESKVLAWRAGLVVS